MEKFFDFEDNADEKIMVEAISNDNGAAITMDNNITSPTTLSSLYPNERIKDFYKHSKVLVSGGTGFVGKVLIQKLLSTFELSKIYILIRHKNHMTVEERLQQFLSESIFNRIRDERPQLLDKIQAIHVNFNAHDLGINAMDRKLLYDEVEIIFNVLASIKFNEKLGTAININVCATKKILDLAFKMPNLKSFLHISTLYSNCNRQHINEKVYENDIDYVKIMQIYRLLDMETLEKFRSCLLGEMPNTYTMTKKCAENLINHQAAQLPAGIFRPPINETCTLLIFTVISTYKEPFPGWTDNLYGPSGLCTWSARGVVHCIYGNQTYKANLVPADYCINAIIASTWDVARRYTLSKINGMSWYEIPVYNYVFKQNNLTWSQYMYLAREGFHEPFDKALWCFSYVIIRWKFAYYITAFFLHHALAYLLDLIALVTGKKCIYTKMYRKIKKLIAIMSWFGLKKWSFTNNNIEQLSSMLNEEEHQLLEFNFNTINWKDYFQTYLSGIRRYYFNDIEKGTTLEKRKKTYQRIFILHRILKNSFGILLIIMCIKSLKKLKGILAHKCE